MNVLRTTTQVLLLLLTVSGYPGTSAGRAKVGTQQQNQMQLDEKACSAFKQADAKMTKLYRQILLEYRKDTLFVQKMRTAQRAWLAFRDAHLASIYPAGDKRVAYGSVNPMCQCMELEKLTEERTEVLRQWVDGIEEGDVCAGSIKVKD